MDAHPNAQRLREYLDCVTSSNMGHLAFCCAEDIVVHFGGNNDLTGDYRGLTEYAAMLQKVQAVTGSATVEVDEIIADEDYAVGVVHFVLQHGSNALTFKAILVAHIDHDEKIKELWYMTHDTATENRLFSDDMQ